MSKTIQTIEEITGQLEKLDSDKKKTEQFVPHQEKSPI